MSSELEAGKAHSLDSSNAPDEGLNLSEPIENALGPAPSMMVQSEAKWVSMPLGEVVSLKTGKLDSNAAEQNGRFPFFTCSPQTLAINSYAFDTEAVILAGNNANGIFCCKYYSGKFNAYQRTYVIEPLDNRNTSCKFIYFYISHIVNHLQELSVGSATKFLTKTILTALPVKLPPRHVQEQIAFLLSALNDRIALLRETNATLEAMAQALFKSWFVDFDPVHANAGTRAATLPAELQALFPSRFTDTPQGPVPEGWKLVPFGELLSHTIGGDWGDEQPTEKNDVRVAIIRGTDLPDLANGHSGRVPIRFTSQKKLATRKLQDGDLVLEVSGGSKDQPTGRSLYLTNGILSQFNCPMEPASFCRLLRPATKEIGVLLAQHMTYIYGLGKTWEYQNQSTGISNFQTMHFLENELVTVPDGDVLRAFSETIRPMVDRAHLTQIAQLATLRDTLLPRLISGQLRLPDAEAALAEAGA